MQLARRTRIFVVVCLSAMFSSVIFASDDIRTYTSSETSTSVTRPSASSPLSCPYLIGFLPVLSLNKGQSKHFVGSIDYALRRANDDLFGGPGTCRLTYRTHDNKADTLESLRAMTRLYADGAVAFIGPEDTCATEARLAAAWNLPMIAFVSLSMILLHVLLLLLLLLHRRSQGGAVGAGVPPRARKFLA